MQHGMQITLDTSFDEALARVPAALKEEGFGVLTEIDVQSTLRQKIGVDMRRYRILGACAPPFAHRALQADLAAGLLLPCNVVLYEDDDGRAVVLAIDPTKTAGVTGVPELVTLAAEVKTRLQAALVRLANARTLPAPTVPHA